MVIEEMLLSFIGMRIIQSYLSNLYVTQHIMSINSNEVTCTKQSV